MPERKHLKVVSCFVCVCFLSVPIIQNYLIFSDFYTSYWIKNSWGFFKAPPKIHYRTIYYKLFERKNVPVHRILTPRLDIATPVRSDCYRECDRSLCETRCLIPRPGLCGQSEHNSERGSCLLECVKTAYEKIASHISQPWRLEIGSCKSSGVCDCSEIR